MLLKKYLSISKVEVFLLIILFIFSLLLLFGVKVEENAFSFFSMKIPLQVKGSVSLIFWKNFHSFFVVFAFFAYLIMAVEDKERDILRPFIFLLLIYLVFSLIFGLKFGFAQFRKSFLSVFFLLFTLYSYIFFFEVILNSRAIGAIFVVFINAFSGLMTYLYNFREILLPKYSSLIEAKYYALPFYQKYGLNFNLKNLVVPALLLAGSIAYKFLVNRKLENG